MRIQSLSIVTYWFPHRLPHLQSMTSSNAFLNQKLVIWYSRICYTFHVYRMLLQVVAMAEQVGEQKLSRTWAEQSHWYSVCDFVAQCTQQGVSFRGWWGGDSPPPWARTFAWSWRPWKRARGVCVSPATRAGEQRRDWGIPSCRASHRTWQTDWRSSQSPPPARFAPAVDRGWAAPADGTSRCPQRARCGSDHRSKSDAVAGQTTPPAWAPSSGCPICASAARTWRDAAASRRRCDATRWTPQSVASQWPAVCSSSTPWWVSETVCCCSLCCCCCCYLWLCCSLSAPAATMWAPKSTDWESFFVLACTATATSTAANVALHCTAAALHCGSVVARGCRIKQINKYLRNYITICAAATTATNERESEGER